MKRLWQLCGTIAFWLGWPALWLYLRGTHRTRVIVLASNAVLLVKPWLGPNRWLLPGGGRHRRENPLQAAVREVHEETGLQLDPVQLKTLDTMSVSEYGIPFTCTIFVADITEQKPVKAQFPEVTQAVWRPISNLERLSPLTKKLLSSMLK